MLKLPYNGSGVIASALCMDKYKTTELLHAHNIPTPRNMLVSNVSWEQDAHTLSAQLSHNFGFPCIIKPHDDGCSVMVSRASNVQELTDALNAVFDGGKAYALVEEFIQGMELTIGVIGNEKPYALPPSQAVAAGGILSLVEKFLPGAGQNITPAPLPAEAIALAQETVVAAYGATGCSGYARIDCFYQDATQSTTGAPRTVILEINSLPALTPATCLFHQAAETGIKPMELIDTIVQLGFEKYGAATQQKSGAAFTAEDTYL
jgi:D-alanine-D-alanine ligase